MAITDPTNTLAFYNSRVLCQHRDMSNVPVASLVAAINAFKAQDAFSLTKPETEAIWFYGVNHLVSLVSADRAPLEPLTPFEQKVLDTYHDVVGPKTIRAFYYLLTICVREFRHCKAMGVQTTWQKKNCDQATADFFKGAGGEDAIHQRLLNHPPATTIGNLCKALRYGFHNGLFGSGYGGPAWGAVADCLGRFVTGEFSAEMMMDTVWTLNHNNGPIFNKDGQGYANYSSRQNILRILDIQRSGQIPNAIRSDSVVRKYTAPDLVDLINEAASYYGDRIGLTVDWISMKALGALGHYPGEVAQQMTKPKTPEEIEAETKAAFYAAQKKKLAEEKALKDAEEFKKNNIEIMPGVFVPKIARAA